MHYDVRSRVDPTSTVRKRSSYWLARLLNPADPVLISDEHTIFVWQELADAIKTAQFEDLQALLTDSADFISKLEES